MITRKSGWPLALACVLASLPTRGIAAEHPHAARWTMSQSFDKCTLTAIARDAGGNGGAALEIAWTRDVGYRAEVNLWPAAPSETNSAREPWDPRAETLLAELLGLEAVPFTFTPAGGEPRNLATPMQGLAIASVMFDACTRAIRQPDLPAQPMFTELRYAIDEHDGVCEFTGTFQLRGNGMWLVLATDGTKHQLKITRRTVGPGEPVTSLDLSSLGGPGRLEAQDASYDFDPKAFKALLADIVGEGRPFKARLRGGEVFAVPFGGKFAGVEGPMFEACARVKLGGTP